jgi:secreted trypsin-like serine protease
VRYTSTSTIINLVSNNNGGYNMQTSNNASEVRGKGGSCFGDSGGPVFYPEDSNVVVGIVSFGMNGNCMGTDWAFRTDIDLTQKFVNGFLFP